MSTGYSFKLKRRLNEFEIRSLWDDALPKLGLLIERYGEDLPVEENVTKDPMVLDFLRTNWLLDERKDKPSASMVTDALWPAYGCVLAHQLGMVWCEVEDSFGVGISMLYFPKRATRRFFPKKSESTYQSISVPPRSYVMKQEAIQNAEIFVDAVALLRKQLHAAGM